MNTQKSPKTKIDAASAVANEPPDFAEIRKLHAAGRLAYHVWEQKGVKSLPTDTIDMFSGDASKLREQTPQHMKIQSVSLLPKLETCKTMMPWNITPYACPDNNYFFGYLLSLNQSQPNPALIVCAVPDVIISGTDCLQKNLIGSVWPLSPLAALYNPLIESLKTIIPLVDVTSSYTDPDDNEANFYLRLLALNDRANTLANRSLNLLQKVMSDNNKNPLEANEVCVSATMKHVKAIVVPMYVDAEKEDLNRIYETQIRLRAALQGLEHLRHEPDSYNFPVMMYHVDGNPELQGQLTFLAQGEEQLIQLALTSLAAALENDGNGRTCHVETSDAKDQINRILGIDITQENALEQVRRKLAQQATRTVEVPAR